MRESRVVDATGSEVIPPRAYLEVVDDLRCGFLSAPVEVVAQRHLADMFVVSEATGFSRRESRRRRRNLVVGSTLGLGAVFAVGGTAAASGSLPLPAQQVVSRMAEHVGLDVPSGHSDEAPGRGGDSPGQSELRTRATI